MKDPNRAAEYAKKLSILIREDTISQYGVKQPEKFRHFHQKLAEMFPVLWEKCDREDFDGSLLLIWHGRDPKKEPILLMNHHDTVEAPGSWEYPPFSGEIAQGKVWGRGTLDNKGGLYCMLQAAEELAETGFQPESDIWFESSCTEETDGSGADAISQALLERGIRFRFVLDEGGMIVYDPIGGSDGTFAMVGVGEKGCADLKFVARGAGGHASTPPRNTALVRLGRFMAAADRKRLFETRISPTVREMFHRIAPTVHGALKPVLSHPRLFSPLIRTVMPKMSAAAGAMLKTTLAFTVARGSEGNNVLPGEAYVIGNMRFSHHQGADASIDAVRKLAAKYDLETVIEDPGFESPVTDFRSEGFRLVERAVQSTFPDVRVSPYIMTGASDARYFSRVSDCCLRFVPFRISDEQLSSIHGVNECVDTETLEPAVDFYKYIIREN